MLDAYNQALIAASYGQLSLGEVAVLSETYIERDAFSAADNFTYYEAPAKQVGCRGSRSSAVKVKVGKSLHKLNFPVLTSSFRPLFDLPDAPSAVPPTSSEWVPGRPVPKPWRFY